MAKLPKCIMTDRKTHKEIKLAKNEISIMDLAKKFNKCKKTIKKCLIYLNIKPIRNIYKNQYPTEIYSIRCIKKLKNFLKENPDTKRFFCSVNNSMKNPDVIKKIVYTRTHRSEKSKKESVKKFKRSYKNNNCSKVNKIKRKQRVLDNCPKGYIPLNDETLKSKICSKNKTNILKQICRYLDIKVINIKNNCYILKNSYKEINNYLTKYYNKPGRYLGESLIAWYLKKLKISYKYQKFFKDCKSLKTNRLLPFDFYIKKYNCCIELDGQYHLIQPIRKYNDKIKTKYCKDNNITLIRIKWGYDKYMGKRYLINTLEKKLNKYLII